jgi:hypothetical protein
MERHKRSYAPKGLKVLKGPGENYEKGSTWMVADPNGYVQLTFSRDEKVVYPNTVYIENIEINSLKRGQGLGVSLYNKVETFSMNIGAEWIQIDSEPEVVGFWVKMGFQVIDIIPEGKRVPMIKKIN